MHIIFVINKYVLLKQVSVQIKCILLEYHIYIRNSVEHTRMKWNSHVFDIVLPSAVHNTINVYNMIRVRHENEYACKLYICYGTALK